jgi:hypothetical protein
MQVEYQNGVITVHHGGREIILKNISDARLALSDISRYAENESDFFHRTAVADMVSFGRGPNGSRRRT